MARPLFVHIGASKTGTSSLQRGLWDSIPQLERAGVGVPFVGRPDHVDNVLRPLGWVASRGYARSIRRQRLPAIVRRLAQTPGDRLLMSNEDLCELDPRRIRLLGDLVEEAGCELHLIVTARDWSQQLPSEWQQFLKHRLTTPYPAFLDQVREHEGAAAAHFHRRQDVAAMARRWTRDLPDERLHLMSVPSAGAEPEGVFTMFGEIVGFDPADLARTPAGANASFGYVEAEVYRRMNEALGERLPDYEKQYYPAVRLPLVTGVLPRKASARITLPPEHLPWVREAGLRQVEELTARGYRWYGDPHRLVAPEDAGRALPQLREEEVSAAAVAALATWAVRSFNRSRSGPRGSGR